MAASGLTSRMLDDSVTDPVLLPRLTLFPSDFQAKPLRQCFEGLNIANIAQTLTETEEFVERSAVVPEGMTTDEALAVALYMSDQPIAAQLNAALRQRSPLLTIWRDFLWHLLCALRKLPRFEGSMCYRAFGPGAASAVRYSKGRFVCWNGLTSATASEEIARRVAEGIPEGATLFTLRTAEAYRLAGLALFNEDEVIFEPNAEFEVTDYTQTGPNAAHVAMVQRPFTRPVLPQLSAGDAPAMVEVPTPTPPVVPIPVQYPPQQYPVMYPSFPPPQYSAAPPAPPTTMVPPWSVPRVPTGETFQQPPPTLGAHIGVRCDACGMDPVSGTRYKCYSCWNFDLCEACFRSGRTAMAHRSTHAMEALMPGQKPGKARPPGIDPHGMRVVRGRDWKWGDQDGGVGGVGTVIKIVKGSPGWYRVIWDNGTKNCYRMGAEDAYDLLTVGRAAARQIVGRRVRRGPDWKWGDQDSGGLGIVINSPREGVIEVRWYTNGNTNHYRYGAEGAYDVNVVSEPKPAAGAPITSPAAPWLQGPPPPSMGGIFSSGSSGGAVGVSSDVARAFGAPEFGRWFSFGVWLIVSPREGNTFVMAHDNSLLVEIVWSSNGWFRFRQFGRDWVVWSRGDKTAQNLHDAFLKPLVAALNPANATPIGNGATLNKERMEMVIRNGVLSATNDGDTVSFPEHSIAGASYKGVLITNIPTRSE